MKDSNATVRVRFAPAPTGMMHLGNVRAAVINYLFARQKNGAFVLRIEDTDAERNYDPHAENIIADLQWLGLMYDEGPGVGGNYGPYFQSQRFELYTEALHVLQEKKACYRCFCDVDMLEKKRIRMQAAGAPPRYDRTCLMLSDDIIEQHIKNKIPFIWRFKLDSTKTVTVNDLAHGLKSFELSNFSDFPLTRSDGSFTFIFANFVDDMHMNITHIFRGEDHLTNSACQASLFDIFNLQRPVYLHMPILCNIDGKKLSKRDFGFSLRDLKDAGFLPEAIVNYLAIIGGSFEQEIMSIDQLIKTVSFVNMHTTGHMKYDVEKLKWINKKWLHACDSQAFVKLAKPFLLQAFPSAIQYSESMINDLLVSVQMDVHTLSDVIDIFRFYFEYRMPTADVLRAILSSTEFVLFKKSFIEYKIFLSSPEKFMHEMKHVLNKIIEPKKWFAFMRCLLTGATDGMSVTQLLNLLGEKESELRIVQCLNLLD